MAQNSRATCLLVKELAALGLITAGSAQNVAPLAVGPDCSSLVVHWFSKSQNQNMHRWYCAQVKFEGRKKKKKLHTDLTLTSQTEN